jgi:hypothetical protein
MIGFFTKGLASADTHYELFDGPGTPATPEVTFYIWLDVHNLAAK